MDWFSFPSDIPHWNDEKYSDVWLTQLQSGLIDPAATVYMTYGSQSLKWKDWLELNGKEPGKSGWWLRFKTWFRSVLIGELVLLAMRERTNQNR